MNADDELLKNLDKLHTTELGVERIKRNLFLDTDDVVVWCKAKIELAKAFDEFCKNTGYEKALPIIDEWLENDNPNTRRAVTEGLRIWTSRPYFKDNPNEAIRRIVALKEDPSEYVRKSVGNALRDISKKFPELIKDELNNWTLESKEINQVYKLASKLIN